MIALIGIAETALRITGFVTVMMLVVEYVNVCTRGRWKASWAGHRWGQYVLAALLGATPGCLGAFAVVGMYAHGVVTRGAVVAAMIATSGDAAFVMFAVLPVQALWLMALLFVIGLAAGAAWDATADRGKSRSETPCEGLELHTEDVCGCFMDGRILRQWRNCSAVRGVLGAALLLIIFGLLAGELGPDEWNWIRFTVVGVAIVALFIVATASDHFLEAHLWRHVFRHHIPRILGWTFGALVAIHLISEQLPLAELMDRGRGLVLAGASLVGLIPESGPHVVFVALYAQGSIPFSVLLANAIVQDGHGMLPLLAHSRRDFFVVKGVNLLAGIAVGATVLLFGW